MFLKWPYNCYLCSRWDGTKEQNEEERKEWKNSAWEFSVFVGCTTGWEQVAEPFSFALLHKPGWSVYSWGGCEKSCLWSSISVLTLSIKSAIAKFPVPVLNLFLWDHPLHFALKAWSNSSQGLEQVLGEGLHQNLLLRTEKENSRPCDSERSWAYLYPLICQRLSLHGRVREELQAH